MLKRDVSQESLNGLLHAITVMNPNTKDAVFDVMLKRITGVNFVSRIIQNKSNKFFGMRIYPSQEVIIELASRIANNRDYHVKELMKIIEDSYEKENWYIEIDSNLFNPKVGLIPKEKLAIVLHELGHFYDMNSKLSNLYYAYILKKANINMRIKNIIRNGKLDFINNLFGLYIIDALTQDKFRANVMASELSADKFVVQLGYGEFLYSALNKITKVYRKDDLYADEKYTKVKDNGDMLDWIINSINSVSMRQIILYKHLLAQAKVSPSLYVKKFIYKNIIPWVHEMDGDTDDGSIHDEDLELQQLEEKYESFMVQQANYITTLSKQYRTEGLAELFTGGRIRAIKEEDIDRIALEIDDIKSKQDKVYVLDLIYDQLDIIEASEDMIAQGKPNKVQMSQSSISRYKETLLKMKAKVLDKNVGGSSHYIVAYPKGYEG